MKHTKGWSMHLHCPLHWSALSCDALLCPHPCCPTVDPLIPNGLCIGRCEPLIIIGIQTCLPVQGGRCRSPTGQPRKAKVRVLRSINQSDPPVAGQANGLRDQKKRPLENAKHFRQKKKTETQCTNPSRGLSTSITSNHTAVPDTIRRHTRHASMARQLILGII